MNSQQSTILIKKHTKSDYETRFLHQSKKGSPTRKCRKTCQMTRSKAMQLLGGEKVLDFLCIYFAEHIVNDSVLSNVYSDINTKTLVQMQKELLLLALDDNLCKFTKNNIKRIHKTLQPHVLLGLMENEEYFDLLANLLADALIDCQLETRAIFTTQRLFEDIRPLLLITQEQLRLESTHIEESVRFPVLGKVHGKRTNTKKGAQKIHASKPWWKLSFKSIESEGTK